MQAVLRNQVDPWTLFKQFRKPDNEFLAEISINFQVSGTNGQTHLSGILSGCQPSMKLRSQLLFLRELSICLRNLFYVALGQ